MKKICLGWILFFGICLAACHSGGEELPPLPTLAVQPGTTVTPVLGVTDMSEESQEIPLTAELPKPTAAATLTPMVAPEATVIPAATTTPIPTATKKPKLTKTPVPTATPTPMPVPTATTKPISPEIKKLLDQAKVFENTIINGELCRSEQDANEYVREMSITYSSYALIIRHAEDLHTPEEYMALYPEIVSMTLEKIEVYTNGICAVFKKVETVYDANFCYALRTGDRTVLTENEKALYAYLSEVLEVTGARNLNKADAVKVLHDYLVSELKYDESFMEISHSPEGVMNNKTAVCDGYARTMRLLLLFLDIECEIVSGTAGNQPHAWNLVKLEDGWYHLDVTWDDPVPDVEGKVSYFYFLKNDAYMAKTHRWKSDISCTGTMYENYGYREYFCDSFETLRDVYESQIQTEEYLVFCYPRGGTLTQDLILEFVKNELWKSFSYSPEQESDENLILEIVNPLFADGAA